MQLAPTVGKMIMVNQGTIDFGLTVVYWEKNTACKLLLVLKQNGTSILPSQVSHIAVLTCILGSVTWGKFVGSTPPKV